VLPAHRGTMRSVRPVAATVPASAAQPELVTAAGPESAAVRRTGPPERRTPPAAWPIQDNKKARVTNSVLEASQLSLLATAPHHESRPPPDPSLSAGQVSGASPREPPKCERTRRMIALTGDFHIIAARIAAGFSAVFFSVCYIAQARDVRALSHLLVRHTIPSLPGIFLLSTWPVR